MSIFLRIAHLKLKFLEFALFWGALICTFLASSLVAISLKKAMSKAAEYFINEAVRIDQKQELHILGIINYTSKQHDSVGKK